MADILHKIINYHRPLLEQKKLDRPLASFRNEIQPSARDFKAALQSPRHAGIPSLICEIKKASPSAGVIRADFDHVAIGKLYNQYANAMSILTEDHFFQGSLQFLRDVSAFSEIPLLRKDFIFDAYQIYEARDAGADAILLIQAVLTVAEVKEFTAVAHELNMHVLLEVHTEEELTLALQSDCQIIGINNRNLHNFVVDIATTEVLAPLVTGDKIIVTESGIKTHQDLTRLSSCAQAALIGTSIMKEDDIEVALQSLISL
jgi:indole-3-glycerol phosphate synthase